MESTGKQILNVIFTGPESTGKTVLSKEMAKRFGGVYVEEYAREYILQLGRKYTYDDVVKIAEMQRSQMERVNRSGRQPVFFDTYLIITKVWFEVVFKRYPPWLDMAIDKTNSFLYLLCRPDIPWVPDTLRENGGAMRQKLFESYEEELIRHGLNYGYIEGTGDERISNAIDQIKSFLKVNG